MKGRGYWGWLKLEKIKKIRVNEISISFRRKTIIKVYQMILMKEGDLN